MYLSPKVISQSQIYGPGEAAGFHYMATTPFKGRWFMSRRTHGFDTGSIVAHRLAPCGNNYRMTDVFEVITPISDPRDDAGRLTVSYEDQTPSLPDELYPGSPLCMTASQVTNREDSEGLRCGLARVDLNTDLTRRAVCTLGTPEELSERFHLPKGSWFKELEHLRQRGSETWHIAEGDEDGQSCLILIGLSKNGITDAKMLLTASEAGAEHLSTGSRAIPLGYKDRYLVFINRRRHGVWSGTYIIVKINDDGVTIEHIAEHSVIEADCCEGEGPQGQTVAFISAVNQLKGVFEFYWHLNDMRSMISRIALTPLRLRF